MPILAIADNHFDPCSRRNRGDQPWRKSLPLTVKALRERTGLPMMDCKKALTECQGDAEAADPLAARTRGPVDRQPAGRETAFGRFGIYASSGRSARWSN